MDCQGGISASDLDVSLLIQIHFPEIMDGFKSHFPLAIFHGPRCSLATAKALLQSIGSTSARFQYGTGSTRIVLKQEKS